MDIARADVERVVGAEPVDARHLVAALLRVQKAFHYVPPAAMDVLAERTGFTPGHVLGVAKFYHAFRLESAGEYRINVCVGTACHLKGAMHVYDAFRKHLGITGNDDTDAARRFTVGTVACLGCCNLAPVVQIGGKIYGNVKQSAVGGVIDDFLAGPDDEADDIPDTQSASGGDGIRTCMCSGCQAGGSAELMRIAHAYRARWGGTFGVAQSRCRGQAHLTPVVDVVRDGNACRYLNVTPDDMRLILRERFRPVSAGARALVAARTLLERIGLPARATHPVTPVADETVAGGSLRMATAGGHRNDPVLLDDYLEQGGFDALQQALEAGSRDGIIADIAASGLRGRGGAGFPTAEKWQAVSNAADTMKYLVCNGDEGDPGAFMDRMLLETYPFRVIEGMLIAAYAVGARQGYCYVRAEYPFAITQMNRAIAACRARGILGDAVLGRPFSFGLEVISGAGAFVCGEETALLAALEGRRGMPRPRPPYPAESGLDGHSTLINNVETLALVPGILRKDEPLFASVGTDSSKGTKVFALAGKVKRGGLIEVPMGTTIRHIVEDIGGGTAGGTPWKGVQIGGPSGGCVPAAHGDTPVDFFRLRELGTMMGSGGIVVLDEGDCMVDIARYFLRFSHHESCRKCRACYRGSGSMLALLDDLCEGRGTHDTLIGLERLADEMRQGSICGLGKSAPNPVLSTLRWFRDEYEAHVRGECPAGVCKDLVRMHISDDCIGCTRCAQHCPAEAIRFTPLEKHIIDPFTCIRCGMCAEVCPEGAVLKMKNEHSTSNAQRSTSK